MQTKPFIVVLFVLPLLIVSCSGISRHDRGQHVTAALPDHYSGAVTPEALKTDDPVESAAVQGLDDVLAEWWRFWGNEELDRLVDSAMAHNHDLRIASWRIAQMEARARQARGAKMPVLSLPAEVRHAAPYGDLGLIPEGGRPNARDLYRLGLRADWRPDLWGEMGSLETSVDLQLWQAAFQRDDMQRRVVAAVIRDYLEYLALNDRLRVARESETSLSGLLKAVENRMEMGDATIIQYEQQKAAVYGIRATIPVLEQQREHVVNRLSTMTGGLPGTLALSDAGLSSLALPAVLPGLPSSLLLRRPDVRAVESRLAAAGADIRVARARLLPPLDLTAQAGYASRHLSQLFQPHTFFYSAVANLTITLFDSRRRTNEIVFAEAVQAEMVETYIRVISEAIRDVDDALVAMQMLAWRMGEQQSAVAASQRAYDHSLVSYRSGDIDHLTLLIAENTLQRNQDELLIVHQARYQRLNDLFSALGGGISLHGVDSVQWQPLQGEPLDDGMVFYGHDFLPESADPISGHGERLSGVMSLDEAAHKLGEEPSDYYLLAFPGIYDRHSVAAAGRNLFSRLPELKASHRILPQQAGRIEGADGERASWYRLWLYRFEEMEAAEAVCLALQREQVRCEVVTVGDVRKASRSRKYASRRVHKDQARVVILQDNGVVPHFAIQLGAFQDCGDAAEAAGKWVDRGYDAAVFQAPATFGEDLHVVRKGRFDSMHDAAVAARHFNERENQDAIPVRVSH